MAHWKSIHKSQCGAAVNTVTDDVAAIAAPNPSDPPFTSTADLRGSGEGGDSGSGDDEGEGGGLTSQRSNVVTTESSVPTAGRGGAGGGLLKAVSGEWIAAPGRRRLSGLLTDKTAETALASSSGQSTGNIFSWLQDQDIASTSSSSSLEDEEDIVG